MIGAYLQLGFEHILDIKGYDHILFVIVLCVAYRVSEWKKMLILITAFTIGHSLTLGLSSLDMVSISSELIEILIPITIILSGLLNIWESYRDEQVFGKLHYFLALLFGLIHGLGFSTFFKSLVSPTESIVPLLFSFNVGVELGQLVIVALVFAISYVLARMFSIKYRWYTIAVSSLCIMAALALLFEKL